MIRYTAQICILFIMVYVRSYAMTDYMQREVALHTHNGQKEFAIVVPTYNNSRYCIENLVSVAYQSYDNYHVYIIDDASTDNTYNAIITYIHEHELYDKVTLLHNTERMGAAANYYQVIHLLPDHVIVLNVDGDDKLAHNNVLSTLNWVYEDQDIWMTYGQFRQIPSQEIGFCKPIAIDTIANHTYRNSEWLTSHLRTYYVWLFKKIDKQDLCYEGIFVQACADRAIVYPLLEMCAGHFACISEVLYLYNCANPLADVRKNLTLQQNMCRYIRSLPSYKPLDGILLNVHTKRSSYVQ